jgi:hypothetical protein
MKRGSRRRPSEPDEWSGGSIIVRRLICLLYTAGGLLSGIPFYGTPTVYVVPANCAREGDLLRTRHMLLHHVAHCRHGATPALRWVGTVSVGERWAHGDMGSSNRAPLDTPRPEPRFNRVWSPPPSRWFACKHVILASSRILRRHLKQNSRRWIYYTYNEYV